MSRIAVPLAVFLNARRAAARLCVATLVALLISCPGDPPCTAARGCAPDDVGADSGGSDAGGPRDSALDATHDLGSDGYRVDGGPTDPGWVALSDLPAGCVVERAQHPERLPALTWTDCGAGCLRATRETNRYTVGFGGGFLSEGRGWLATISFTADATRDMYAIMPVDGPPVAAWLMPHDRIAGGCWMAWGSVGEGRAAVDLYWESDATMSTVEERIFVAPMGDIGAAEAMTSVLGSPDVGPGRLVEEIAVGSDVVAVQVSPVGEMLVLNAGAVVAASPSEAFHPTVEADHVLWEDGASEHLWHWTPEAGAEIYYSSPDADLVARPMADRGTLVWIHYIVSATPARVELWTSPLARTPSGLTPRLVHPDVGLEHSRFADGVYLAVRSVGPSFSAQLTDVSDGRVRMLGLPEPGIACIYAHYVSSTELLLDCAMPGTSPAVRMFYRIDPRTLPYSS